MFESNCIDACGNWDFNCPVEERCCPNQCGWSCHRPVDLERVKSLPPVPVKLSVMESRRKIEICWDVYAEIKVSNFVFMQIDLSATDSVSSSSSISPTEQDAVLCHRGTRDGGISLC